MNVERCWVVLAGKHRNTRREILHFTPTKFLTWAAPGSNLSPRADTPEVQRYNMRQMKIQFPSATKLLTDSVTACSRSTLHGEISSFVVIFI
jgi:hypothetical protein